MKFLLISSLVAVAIKLIAAENEPPKLQPLVKSPARTEPAEKASPQKSEIMKLNADYVLAFDRGDSKALGAFYTEDADQMDANGALILAGRAAIEKQLSSYFGQNEGASLYLSITSLKLLAPEVIMENGEAVVTKTDGDTSMTAYLAIHVKRNGKWLIAHLTESPIQAAASPYSHLQELEWMVGSWKDDSSDAEVTTDCHWATNKTFLTRSFSAKVKDRGELEGTEVIGWDPLKGKIRTWIFDSEGGFSEGTWTREANRWLIQLVSTLPDGRKASAHQTITHVNDDKYLWESSNRMLDGEVRPDIARIEINRVKPHQ